MRKPLITAHSGCNDTPQNSVESVLAGADWGADINEIDVRATLDGIPILWHDEAIHTKHNGMLKVESLTYDEIEILSQRKDIDFPHRADSITSLENVFDAIKGKQITLNLDLKDDECIVPVSKMVKERNLAENVIFTGCEKVRASYLKSNNPEFQVLLNAEERLIHRKDMDYIDKVKILCNTAVLAGCCGLNIPYDFCRQELIDYADYRFLPVAVWTVSPDDDFETFINMGVSSITTFHVKELVELKRNRMS